MPRGVVGSLTPSLNRLLRHAAFERTTNNSGGRLP
jgi:hypothetical protein